MTLRTACLGAARDVNTFAAENRSRLRGGRPAFPASVVLFLAALSNPFEGGCEE